MQYILVVAEAKATYLLGFDHLKYDLNLTQTYLLENICALFVMICCTTADTICLYNFLPFSFR